MVTLWLSLAQNPLSSENILFWLLSPQNFLEMSRRLVEGFHCCSHKHGLKLSRRLVRNISFTLGNVSNSGSFITRLKHRRDPSHENKESLFQQVF